MTAAGNNSADRSPLAWAQLSTDELCRALDTRSAGLTAAVAAQRLRQHGPNVLPRGVRPRWYAALGRHFIHLMALLLWAGAAIAWYVQMPELATAIVGVLVINGAFSFWQQYKAEQAIAALEALLPQQALVRRAGDEQLIPVAEIVPGDMLLLREGAAVAADARLIQASRLRIDMASLSGESRPTPRTAAGTPDGKRSVTEIPQLVLAGTTVATGTGEAVVIATGARTEFGRLAALTQQQPSRPSPLEVEVQHVTRAITLLACGMGALFFIVGASIGGLSTSAAFVFALGMIVANVPEGLLPTLTLALAMGVRRMALRKAIVKRLEKVETLGSTTVILTDKTGTLTENQMTVREVWGAGTAFPVTGVGYEVAGSLLNVEGTLREPLDLCEDSDGTRSVPITATAAIAQRALHVAALCCDAQLKRAPSATHWEALGDPTEIALLVAAAKVDFPPPKLAESPRLAELPFDSTRKRMTTIQRLEGRTIACVKGAFSQVAEIAVHVRTADGTRAFDAAERQRWQGAHDELARRGLRVLAIAERELPAAERHPDDWRVEEVEREVVLLGLVAMDDPPRSEVPAAIAACRAAGIRVVMVTGDNGLTAATIGREIGLHPVEPYVVDGMKLDTLTDAALGQLLDHPDLLFARVAPEHKLRLVEAFQRRGEIVAVTGDGVNDAPALRRADVGVAMGKTGTDVARAAADMVLADDHFASIVFAIEEGRTVYDNVRKFATYILASNVPEAVPFIVFVLFGVPLPLTIMQILAVDLGTDLLPALALGAELPERDVMHRPPRPRNARLLDVPTLWRAYAWLGMLEALLGLAAYYFAQWWAGWRPGLPLAAEGPAYVVATTMSLAAIVACQVGNLFACRSAWQSAWRLPWFQNRLLWWGIAFEIGLLALLIYTPPLARIFNLAPLSPVHWLALGFLGPTLLGLEELRKAWLRRQPGR